MNLEDAEVFFDADDEGDLPTMRDLLQQVYAQVIEDLDDDAKHMADDVRIQAVTLFFPTVYNVTVEQVSAIGVYLMNEATGPVEALAGENAPIHLMVSVSSKPPVDIVDRGKSG